jgi:hypothetical protein
MSLIPGSLPSDTCYGTPQELLELFAQYLDIPAFAISSKVLYSTVDPSPNTDFLWVNTTVAASPVLSVYNNGAYREYPFEGSLSPGRPETLISARAAITTLAGSDRFLVSQAGTSNVLKKITWTNMAGQIPAGTVTFPMLSTSATEASNVAKRTAKAWVNFDGTGTVAVRGTPFNVSSITDNGGSGNYTVNFAVALTDANYAIFTTTDNGSSVTVINTVEITSQSTAGCTITTQFAGGGTGRTATDKVIICVGVFGS